jgi:hypothetical protein
MLCTFLVKNLLSGIGGTSSGLIEQNISSSSSKLLFSLLGFSSSIRLFLAGRLSSSECGLPFAL